MWTTVATAVVNKIKIRQTSNMFKLIYYLLQLNIFLWYRGPFETIQIICAVINISKIVSKRSMQRIKL